VGGGNAGVGKQKWVEAQVVGVGALLPGSTSTPSLVPSNLGPAIVIGRGYYVC
jgi:hypothetical protein